MTYYSWPLQAALCPIFDDNYKKMISYHRLIYQELYLIAQRCLFLTKEKTTQTEFQMKNT